MQWKSKRGSVPIKRAPKVGDIFATGLASVEHHGDYVRLTFVSDNALAATLVPYSIDQTVVASIVIPASAYRDCVRALLDAPPLLPQ